MSPSNSHGAIDAVGDAFFGRGSTYVAEITPPGEHDLIRATGWFDINDGTVQMVAEPGQCSRRRTYTIADADRSVRGRFNDDVSSNLALLTP